MLQPIWHLGGRIANNIFKDISENISVKFGDLGCSSSGEDNTMPQPMKGQISHLETKSTLRGAFLVASHSCSRKVKNVKSLPLYRRMDTFPSEKPMVLTIYNQHQNRSWKKNIECYLNNIGTVNKQQHLSSQ